MIKKYAIKNQSRFSI